MKRHLMPFTVTMLAGSALSANAPRASAPLTQVYPMQSDISLVADGRPNALIARPEQSDYASLADEFASRFEETAGVRLPIVPEGEVSSSIDGRSTVILFGNSATGPLSMRLYANKLVGADARYPGEGGYELRAFSNALDLGVSVLFMGGSSPEAARSAVDDLFDRLRNGNNASIPYTLEWVCPQTRVPPPLTDADIEREVQRAYDTLGAFQWQQFRSACGQFCRSAEHYYLSGDDSYGRLCARQLEVLSTNWDEEQPHPPTFVMNQVVMALDQVEESGGMTDEDRLRGAELVRRITETTMEFWEMREPNQRYEEGTLGPIWNHQTYPALSIAHAAQYLKARFDIPAADHWEAVVDHLFRGQITCDQPLEDSANYQWSVAKHTIAYVLATGRLTEYFTNGSLLSALEYAIASHGPAGNEATHGDAWKPFGSNAGALFQQAASRYRDPRYAYLLSLIGGQASGMWQYPIDIEPRQPDDHIGLRTFVVDPARSEAYGIEGIPADRVLDKVVFRSGWDPDADYLMLDGVNVGNHKHIDANAIIRYSTQGRYWLVDMDYIRAVPKHHNSIVVVRDGVGPDISPTSRRDAQVIAEPPLAAELICSSGTNSAALSQSRLHDYGGMDWDRHIFWKAKDFTVVIDRLRAIKPGHYTTQAFWRTLGETSLEGSVLRVQQSGDHPQHFCITNADGSRPKLRQTFDYGHGGAEGYYADYPFADRTTQVLVQTKTADLEQGDALTYANLFGVRERPPEWDLLPIGENAWLISGDSRAVIGIGPVRLEDLEVESGMFLLTDDGLLTAGSDVPSPDDPEDLLERLSALASRAPEPSPAPPVTTVSVPVAWTHEQDSQITAVASGDGAVYLGTESGDIVRLDEGGREVWQKPVGSRVRCLAWTNRNVLLSGSHAGDVIALDVESADQLWSYTCESFHGRTGSVATVFPADLDGDGKHEFMAGSDNWHYHAFSPDGELLWRTNTTHASTIGCAGDHNGDGKEEVLAGCEYYGPSILDSSGKRIGKIYGGPVITATALLDLDGDGKAEALVGMEDGFVRCRLPNGDDAWKTNVGGSPTALVPLDVDGDGRLEVICASESFSVYAIRADGSLAWRTELSDSVNDLAVVGSTIVAGCDDGRIYRLDRTGTITGSTDVRAPISHVVALGEELAVVSAGPTLTAIAPTP